MSEDELYGISRFEEVASFSAAEKSALRFALAISDTPPTVTQALFDELRTHYREAALVELAAVGAFENYLARFNRVFAVEAAGFSEGAFCPLPDHPHDVTEAGAGSATGSTS